MIGRIWGALSAGIGAVIIVVILNFSLRLGAWVDDAQISDPTMPSPFFPLMGAMVLGAVLVVGGLIAAFGSSGTARRT